jgi:hypothetical protein
MIIKVEVKGVDEFIRKTKNFQAELAKANAPLAAMIVQLVTLPRGDGSKQTYPQQTARNHPPPPFYRRGIGTQVSARHNLGNSEQLHTHFTYTTKPLQVTIKNNVSYAKFVIGYPNTPKMRSIGWRSLYLLARDKIKDIHDLYLLWMIKTLKDLKLK